MSFDYFYGQQSDLFTFYRVPKVLFTNERFWNISADAKMLYGILLDRMSLSAKNGWIDSLHQLDGFSIYPECQYRPRQLKSSALFHLQVCSVA